ncbi:MAG: hypothetical protein HZC22_13370 [Rhodocyclales bacterium]|nr:hypothetical protein [Rhodocyclales bacterium]
MTIRVNTDLQAVYIHEPLGHTCPAMTAAWTVAGLFRMEADVNLGTLLAARYGDTAGTRWLGLFLDGDGTTVRITCNNGSTTQSAGYTLVPGEDYHLALDYDGAGTARMVLDGAPVLSLSVIPTAGTNGERSFQIGGYGEISGYTSCTVARWRMWSAVLTEAQHRAEFRSLTPVVTSGLLHNWPMVAGATRLNDTVGTEPDLAQNDAVPVGDGAAFVYRPSIIGAPLFVDLGQTTTPGAQSLIVPTYAEGVAILFAISDSADTPDAVVASLASTFAGTFAINNSAPTAVSVGGSICVADVTSTGAGKTFTPTFSATSIVGGVVAAVAFLQDVPDTWLTDFATAHATGDGTAAGTASADGIVDGLAIALDAKLSATSANYPAPQAGWDNVGTGQAGPGTYAYYTCARLRKKSITATGVESATTQAAVLASCVSILTIAPGTLAAPIELAGAAVDTASATGAITTGIPVAGASFVVATGTGSMSTGIPLAGISAAVAAASASMSSGAASFAGNAAAAASGAGQLSALITFSSAALAQALSSALLATGITMTTAAIVQAAADGTLATAIALLGGAASQASAPGSLTAGSGLSGAGAAAASAAAALTIQIRFAASAFMSAAAAAGLDTAILMTGQGAGQAGGSGTLSGGALFAGTAGAAALALADLTTAIQITGGALAQAIAAGGLTVEVGMAGLAAAFASGAAALQTQIQVAGAAAVEASSTGSLDVGVPVVFDPRYEIRTRRSFKVRTRRRFEVFA